MPVFATIKHSLQIPGYLGSFPDCGLSTDKKTLGKTRSTGSKIGFSEVNEIPFIRYLSSFPGRIRNRHREMFFQVLGVHFDLGSCPVDCRDHCLSQSHHGCDQNHRC